MSELNTGVTNALTAFNAARRIIDRNFNDDDAAKVAADIVEIIETASALRPDQRASVVVQIRHHAGQGILDAGEDVKSEWVET